MQTFYTIARSMSEKERGQEASGDGWSGVKQEREGLRIGILAKRNLPIEGREAAWSLVDQAGGLVKGAKFESTGTSPFS